MGILRSFVLAIDKAVYWAVGVIFQLIIDLSNYQLFTSDTIKSFSNRIYIILGVVMVFKLMISFIQILIDPDKMSDKEKGAVGVLKRVVISMVLIATVSSIFDFAMSLQEQLLPILPKVILGSSVDIGGDSELINGTGNLMAYYSFTAFFYPYNECRTETNLKGFGNDAATIDTVGAITSKDVNATCSASPDSDGYMHRYSMFVATIAGAFLVYVLVTIAVKIAIRAIKLSLCRIIAPIPIASYIDPKTSKQSFDKWVETSIKTYVDLFTRLAVVYFIIYIFQLLFVQVTENGLTRFTQLVAAYNGDYGRASLVSLFIIVGLLYFAKEMPKFITSMLGISDSMSDIGDMLKGQGWRQLGTTIGGAAGLAAQPISSAVTNYRTARKMGEGKGTALRRAVNTGIGGVARSGKAFLNNEGFAGAYTKAHQTSFKNAVRRINIDADKRREREERESQRHSGNIMASIYDRVNHATGADSFSAQMSEYKSKERENASMSKRVKDYDKRIAELRQKQQYHINMGDREKANEVGTQIALATAQQSALQAKISSNQSDMQTFKSNIESAYTSSGRTADEFKQDWNTYEKDIQHAPGTVSGTISGAWNTFVGNPVPTSKDYSTGKSLMDQATGIFKAFAATIDEEPSKVTGTYEDTVNKKTISGLTYSDFLSKYQEAMTTGKVNMTYIDATTGRTVTGDISKAEMIEYHKHIQKKATIQFANDIKKNNINDPKRKDMIDQYIITVGRQLNLSQSDMRIVESDMQANIGKFLADADDKAKNYSRIATEMEGRERLKEESKKG